MTIDFVLIGSRELRRLIRTPARGNVVVEDTVKCVSTVDVLLEIEFIKKRRRRNHILRVIREGKCSFYEALSKGYLQTAMLDANAVQNGLFISSDDFYDVQFWEPAIDRQIDPSYSVRLVSLKAYDMNCGTQFHLEIVGNL